MKNIRFSSIIEYILLFVFSLLGNIFSVKLFVGIDLLFGSIGVFLILFRFGLLAAIPATIISSAYTYLLWNHPFAIVIFVLEILFTGILFKRTEVNILFINVLYWMIIGSPLIMFFYFFILQITFESVFLVILKQCLNGILNLILALIIFNFIYIKIVKKHVYPTKRYFSINNLLFILFILFFSIPSSGILYFFGNNEFNKMENKIITQIEQESGDVGEYLKEWIKEKEFIISQISAGLTNRPVQYSEALQENLQLVSQLNPEFNNIYVADKDAITRGFYPPVDNLGKSTIGLDQSDRDYYRIVKESNQPYISDVFMGNEGFLLPIVIVCCPIFDKGAFSGFALGALKLDELNKRFNRNEEAGMIHKTLLDSRSKIMATNYPLKALSSFDIRNLWNLTEIKPNLFHAFRKEDVDRSLIASWENSVYLGIVPIDGNQQWSLIVELAVKPFLAQLNQFYSIGMFILVSFAVFSVVISFFIARHISKSLILLRESTQNMTMRIENEEVIQWPKTGMIEINDLISNFIRTSQTLKSTMNQLKENQEILESKVSERTIDLIQKNMELTLENENRMKLEKTLMLQERAIQSTEEGIVITHGIDKDYRVFFVNQAFEKLTEYSQFEIFDKSLRILQGPKTDKGSIQKINEALRSNASIAIEIINYKKSGRTFWNYLIISPIFDQNNDVTHFVGTMQDVSVRKKYELNLKIAKRQAEEANYAKSRFLSTMSHEIRTPMNHIIYMIGFLEATDVNKEQLSYIHKLKDSSRLLMALINDILDLSRIESGKIVLESIPFQLDRIMKEVLDIMEDLCRGKDLYIKYEKHEELLDNFIGDPYRIKQIVMNLLSNAVKFTQKGGIIVDITSQKLQPDVQEVTIQVIDTGIGVSDEKKSTIFERFTQVDSSITRKYGGTGIGLSISKKFVELMNGSISVRDNPNGGAIFTIILPLRIYKTQEHDKVKNNFSVSSLIHKAHFLKPYHILLAEDDRVNRLILKKILVPYGAQVVDVENGEEAFEEYKSRKYDLILLDIQMPVMDGYTATREIRKYERENHLKRIPIIALTALAFEEEIKKSITAGMDAHVTKPIDLDDLLQKIKGCLNLDEPAQKAQEESQDERIEWLLNKLRPDSKIEISKSLKTIGYDLKLYLNLMNLFINQYEEYQNEDFLLGLDIDELNRFLHSIKSSAYNIGAHELSQLAKEIEARNKENKAVDKRDIKLLSQYFTKIINDLKEICVYISKINEDDKNVKIQEQAGKQEIENLQALVDIIHDKLKSNDMTTLKEFSQIKEILKDKLDEEGLELLDQTYSLVKNLEFKKAEKNFSLLVDMI